MLPKIEIKLDNIFSGKKGLPPLPEVVTTIQEMIRRNDVDLKKITEMVTSDVSLVTQILKIVNSAYYGLSREVSNLRFAIAYLGINEINRIVISISVVQSFDIKDKRELKKFWRHSFYTALCTKKLAKVYARLEEAEDLWSSSLLHDIGKLVYMQFYPEHYAAIQAYANQQGMMFSEAETEMDVPSSSSIGVSLCNFWRLPTQIRTACQYHSLDVLKNLEMGTPQAEFQRIICLGNLFSQLSEGELSEGKKREIALVIMEKTGCTEEQFLAHAADAQALQFQVDEFMQQLF